MTWALVFQVIVLIWFGLIPLVAIIATSIARVRAAPRAPWIENHHHYVTESPNRTPESKAWN